MQHPKDKSHIWASLSAGSLFNSLSSDIHSATSLPCSHWQCGKQQHICNYDMHVFARVDSCVCVWVHVYAFISVCVCASCLALKWYMMRLCCPSNQCSQPHSPPLSFYRKLIGGCHWCVKLLCVGRCRQLDYLFFIFSILEQLPSALLLFLNEILFPSVALKDTVIFLNRHMVGGLVVYLVMFDQKFLSPILWIKAFEWN